MPATSILLGALLLPAAIATGDPASTTGLPGSPLDADGLAALRGGEVDEPGPAVGNTGTVDGNTATHVVAGSNLVDGGSFSGAAGINTVIQNSGANVLIQNGTTVNVRIGGGP
jgi:hypothetical protein